MSHAILPQTQFEFVLPKGLIDSHQQIHRNGVMRLATARDEIVVQRDMRSRTDPGYVSLVMLAQVITQLGSFTEVSVDLLENLFSHDLAYLKEFYNRINQQGNATIPVECPCCHHSLHVEMTLAGEF